MILSRTRIPLNSKYIHTRIKFEIQKQITRGSTAITSIISYRDPSLVRKYIFELANQVQNLEAITLQQVHFIVLGLQARLVIQLNMRSFPTEHFFNDDTV